MNAIAKSGLIFKLALKHVIAVESFSKFLITHTIKQFHRSCPVKSPWLQKIEISNANLIRKFSTTNVHFAMFNVQDEEEFNEKVIKSEKPVIVDFFANWCGPCKILGPRLESIVGGKEEKVHLAKIDIDKVSDLALEYGVSAVPSVIAIKDGKVVDKFVGLQDESRIDAFVRKLIDQ